MFLLRQSLIVIAALVVPALAAAETPVAVLVGSQVRLLLSDPDVDSSYGLLSEDRDGIVGALAVSVAYRLPHHVAVGARAAISWRRYGADDVGNMFASFYEFHDLPVDTALAVQYEPGDRVFVSPWLGRRFTRRSTTGTFCSARSEPHCDDGDTRVEWRSDQTIVGLTAGLDVLGSDRDRLAIFLDFQLGIRDGSAIGFGVGYRR